MKKASCTTMPVKLKDILSNPFRNVEAYPADEKRVKTLMESIESSFFWENLMARPSPSAPGKYELAYGEHRIKALRNLGHKTIQLTVNENIDDTLMLKMMADENAEDYGSRPEVLHETVKAVRGHLQKMLNDFEWLLLPESGRSLFKSKHGFETAQGKGVGRDLIQKFLGRGYSKHSVTEALASIKAEEEGEYDLSAGEQMKSTTGAAAFRRAVEIHKVPKEKQKAMAEKIASTKPSSREIRREVEKEAAAMRAKKRKTSKPPVDPKLQELEKLVLRIEEKSRSLANNMAGAVMLAEEMQVEDIQGIAKLFTGNAISDLLHGIRAYAGLFGFDAKQLLLKGGRTEG